MPDIVVHTSMGKKVLERINMDIDKNIFRFGLLGPDPYLFYNFFVPPFRNRVNKYSSIMHRQRTGDFLTELANRSFNNRKMFSYLCGFLCHYALDSNTHPYICKKANYGYAQHMAIEHRLDNIDGGGIIIPDFLPESMKNDVGGAIRKIYGFDDPWNKLKKGHSHMAPFYSIVYDRTGMLDKLVGWTRTKVSYVSYKSDMVSEIDLSGFRPLYNKAVNDGVIFLMAAKEYVVLQSIDEYQFRKIIGNRSYIDG